MFPYKTFKIGLIGLSASTILFGNAAFGQTVNQQVNGSAVGPETFVEGTNFTVNPTGTLNQTVNCEARNDVPNIDPSCKGHNTAIYGGKPSHGGGNNHDHGHHHPPHNHPGSPNLNQTVTNGGTNTTVITPTTSNSTSNSNSNSSSESNSNSSSHSNSNAKVSDSGNSNNNNTNVSQGGNAKVGNINNSSSSQVGDQKNQQSVTTGANNVSPNISPSTRVKVDGDQYNSIQFGNQAPGTGGEAFSFNYRSACGTAVSYRQGFALKPRRIGGGGFGFALDVSSTDMDTIENRSGVQGKMDTAFLTAMNVVDYQQNFEQRLNNGSVSRQEAETRAIANCAPSQQVVRNVSSEKTVEVRKEYVDRRRTCTSQGCN